MKSKYTKSKYTGPIKNYVINLDRAQDRWQHIEQEFSKLGLETVRVPAIDARKLTVDDIKHYRRGCYRILKDTEVACFLSHRRCWELIVAGEEEEACIFEDDAYLSSLLPDFLEKRPWPADIELLSMEQFDPILVCMEKPVWQEKGYSIYRNLDYNPGTAGYMVSKSFAKTLLKHSEEFYHLVDAYLFSPRRYIANRYNAYQVTPALCAQGYNNADIAESRPVIATMQEMPCRFSSKAPYKKKNLAYYWRRLCMVIKYKYYMRQGVPVQIDFKE